MPFFMSRKKSAKARRELSPIGRLAVSATSLVKQTTHAISSSQSELSTMGRDQIATSTDAGRAASPVLLEVKRHNAENTYEDRLDTKESLTFTNSLENKFSINSEITNVSADSEVDHFQRHYPETQPTQHHNGELERIRSPTIVSDTQQILTDLRTEIDDLHETNLNLRTDKQILMDQLESNIEVLTQENTMLKTQINASPPETITRRDRILGNSEKIDQLASVLEAQVEVLAAEHNISPARAAQNRSPKVLKRMEQHIPPWVTNFDDLGPLIDAFNVRLQIAYRKILENQTRADSEVDKLEEQSEQQAKDNELLKQHLVDLSQRCQNLTEAAQELLDPVEAERVLEAERKVHAKERSGLEEELATQTAALEQATVAREGAIQKLNGALKTNQKYIATQQTLMERVDQLGAELAISKTKEMEWKHHVDRSVTLLEKALQERDIYHQLAAREHQNCRHAINSASSLKLQHLRDLSNMFQENQKNGNLMKAHDSSHFHSIQQEINTVKGSLTKRVGEMERSKDARRSMLAQIDDMVEKMSLPVEA